MTSLPRSLAVLGVLIGAAVLPSAAAAAGWVSPAGTLSGPLGSPPTSAPMVASNARGDTVVMWQNASPGPFLESERAAGAGHTFTTGSEPNLTPSGGSDLNQTSPEFGSLGLDDAGNIYLFFESGSGSGSTTQINVATKPIGGSTWTVTVIEPAGNNLGFIPSTPVYGAVAPNGAAAVVWEHDDLNNFLASNFQFSSKAAGSSTWSPPADIVGTSGGGTYVRTAVDSSDDIAAIFGFVGSPNYKGATRRSGGSWTTANQITSSPGGSSNVTNGTVAMDSTGQATAIWSMSDNTGSNPVVQFSTKALSASSWPQATSPTDPTNDLSPSGSSAGQPSLGIGSDRTTTVAYTLGSQVFARTRPAGATSFTSATLPNSLTSPSGAVVASGDSPRATVLWSGMHGSTPEISVRTALARPAPSRQSRRPRGPATRMSTQRLTAWVTWPPSGWNRSRRAATSWRGVDSWWPLRRSRT